MHHDAHGHAEERIEGSHPLRVAPGQIVVHGDHVHAEAREGIEIHGKRGNEGLSLPGRHLRDLPLMEYDATYELGVEMAHVEDSSRRFPDRGEGLGQNGIEFFAARQPLLELRRHLLQLVVRQRAHPLFQGTGLADQGLNALQLPFVLGADDFLQDILDHV